MLCPNGCQLDDEPLALCLGAGAGVKPVVDLTPGDGMFPEAVVTSVDLTCPDHVTITVDNWPLTYYTGERVVVRSIP